MDSDKSGVSFERNWKIGEIEEKFAESADQLITIYNDGSGGANSGS